MVMMNTAPAALPAVDKAAYRHRDRMGGDPLPFARTWID